MSGILFSYNDGGRSAAGYRGRTGDCVCRAIAIAADLPYQEVYDALSAGNAAQRKTSRSARSSGKRTAADGISIHRKWFRDYMARLGFVWTSTMSIGSGCTTHLRGEELPSGRLVVQVSKHMCAVVDGVLQDTYDCSRGGNRCVYGYWVKGGAA